MDTPFIPQMEPWFGEEEKRALCEYMDEGGFITEFKRTQQFERMVGDFTGAGHCELADHSLELLRTLELSDEPTLVHVLAERALLFLPEPGLHLRDEGCIHSE